MFHCANVGAQMSGAQMSGAQMSGAQIYLILLCTPAETDYISKISGIFLEIIAIMLYYHYYIQAIS